MSRPISYTSALTVNLSSYSGCTTNVTGATGTNAPTVALKSSGTSSSYAIFSASTRNSSGYIYYMFDVSDIPQGASITSVSCTSRAAVRSTSSGTTSLQLMAGSSTKGTYSGVTNTSTGGTTVLLAPTGWTRSELNNIALRIYTNKTRNATGSHVVYFHGATLTVNYSVNGTEYEITINNSTTATTEPTGTTYVLQGESQEIKIYTNNITNFNVTDNGNQITPVIVSGGSASFSLTEYDSTSSSASTSSTNMANGATGTGSTTYATLYGGRNATYYYYYNFSITGIPQDATIQQLSLSVKGCRYSTYGWNAILCKGTTEVDSVSITASGSSTNSGGTPMVDVLTSTNFGVSDLTNIKLKLKPTQGSNNSRLFFYGADLVITYTVDNVYYVYTISNISADHTIVISDVSSDKMYMKVNGEWVGLQKVHKKINGSWVEQTDLTNVFESDKIYVRN